MPAPRIRRGTRLANGTTVLAGTTCAGAFRNGNGNLNVATPGSAEASSEFVTAFATTDQAPEPTSFTS